MPGTEFTVYTIPNCSYCLRAKSLLNSLGLKFNEILMSIDDENSMIELQQKTNMKTMPQILYGNKLIGGFSDLSKLHTDGKLTEFIFSVDQS